MCNFDWTFTKEEILFLEKKAKEREEKFLAQFPKSIHPYLSIMAKIYYNERNTRI
mgnify:CR=1 FL=1